MALKSSNKKSSKAVAPVKASPTAKPAAQKKPVVKAAASAPKVVAPAPRSVPSAPKPKPVVATPVSDKQSITFTYFAPQAGSVLVAGDFTKWETSPISLVKEETGMWKTTLTLKPGKYQYRLLVDGQWQNDPECTLHVANPFGTSNNVREIH